MGFGQNYSEGKCERALKSCECIVYSKMSYLTAMWLFFFIHSLLWRYIGPEHCQLLPLPFRGEPESEHLLRVAVFSRTSGEIQWLGSGAGQGGRLHTLLLGGGVERQWWDRYRSFLQRDEQTWWERWRKTRLQFQMVESEPCRRPLYISAQ